MKGKIGKVLLTKSEVNKPTVAKSLQLSRKIPADMKSKIEKYLLLTSKYKDGVVFGLRTADGLSKISAKVSGCSFGADKDGFFVYTHRGRSKSHKNPLTLTNKEIDWVESTG